MTTSKTYISTNQNFKIILVNGQGVCCHEKEPLLFGAALFCVLHRLFTHPIQPGLIISRSKQKGISKSMMQLGRPLLGARADSLPLLVSPRRLGAAASDELSYSILIIEAQNLILAIFLLVLLYYY
jgi:hypothetical protein